MIDYNTPSKLVLDSLWFSYRGEVFKGNGFAEWNPTEGFQIDAFLDKTFAPVDSFKTLGQLIINDKNDAFTIFLKIRGIGSAIAPRVFPLAQKKSHFPDNHLSLNVKRIIFFFRWPKECDGKSESWSGSSVVLIKKELEFPEWLKHETSLAGQIIESQTSTGLSYTEAGDFSVSGRHLSDNSFELNWSLPKSAWTKVDAWNFGEAARKALSIIFAQTIWIANSKITRGNLEVFDFRRKGIVESLKYDFRPLIDLDCSGSKQRAFNKDAFIKLVTFFTKNNSHADVCWNIFRQMADASRQETWQGRELLLSTILEAIFRTINNRAFKSGNFYGRKDREKDMDSFQKIYLTVKWSSACSKALETHTRLRHRNAHPDWLTTPDGVLSKEELKKSTNDLVFLSRFYGYMILALAGFKDLEPLFPIVRFEDECRKLEPTKS